MTTSPIAEAIAELSNVIEPRKQKTLKVNTVESIEDEFIKGMLQALYNNMVIAERNIPLNKAQIAVLPLGFTETSIYPTKNFKQHRSQYFLPKQYPHLESLINFKSLINKLNLEVSE